MARIKPTPSFLKGDGRRFWRQVLSTYALTDCDQFELLAAAAECLDTMATARAEIARQSFFVDRWGQTKQSPGFKILNDAKNQFTKLIRELGLSLDEEVTRMTRRY